MEDYAMTSQTETQSFGIVIDGELVLMPSIPSAAIAERLLRNLPGRNRKIEIVNRATGEIVKSLSP
jgi:hypothetical protein